MVDPPWPYESHRTEYPTMPLEEILALPIAKLASKSCVLWLWTTNAMMRHVYPYLDRWGFHEKTILTWAKRKPNTGNWLLNTTEHAVTCDSGQRGGEPHRADDAAPDDGS